MRVWIVAGMMALAAPVSAQDGAHVATLAKVKGHKASLAGEFMRVENVAISNFSHARGGLASDATGSIRFDDAAMSQETIGYLERYCGGAPAVSSRAQCRGALEFTMRNADEQRGGLVISEVNFIPEG